MPLPSSPNRISADLIQNEFGRKSSENWKISDYRRSVQIGGVVWPLDEGIPTGSNDTIRFSDFHGKQHNIVIVMSGGTGRRKRILSDKTSIDSTGFRSTNSSVRRTSKNIVYIDRIIGSSKGPRETVALRTQTNNAWFNGPPNGAKVLIIVSPNGGLYGAGGNGGDGGPYNRDGENGENGTSALGLEIEVESVSVEPGGIIVGGGGGGAGGGGGRETSKKNRKAGGGGGGGGAGFPFGVRGRGGEMNNPDDGEVRLSEPGEDATLISGGSGGEGGDNDGEAYGGGGGGGGSLNPNGSPGTGNDGEGGATGGEDGSSSSGDGGDGGDGDGSNSDNGGESDGGRGGLGGYAITRKPGISAPTLNGSGRIHGAKAAGGVL